MDEDFSVEQCYFADREENHVLVFEDKDKFRRLYLHPEKTIRCNLNEDGYKFFQVEPPCSVFLIPASLSLKDVVNDICSKERKEDSELRYTDKKIWETVKENSVSVFAFQKRKKRNYKLLIKNGIPFSFVKFSEMLERIA